MANNRKIWIGDVNGSGAITFDLLRISTPYPEFNIQSNGAKSYQMSVTDTTKGNRVWSAPGADSNHLDITFKLFVVSSSELTKLRNWYKARPPVVLFSNDDKTTRYFAIFPEGGLEVTGDIHNEQPNTAAPFHNIVSIKLSMLTSTSTNFS